MRLVKSLILLTFLAGSGCYDMGPPPSASGKPRDPRAAVGPEARVYPVLDAAGRTFVPLGTARRAPERRGAPTVLSHDVAVEFADEQPLSDERTFTVVDARGTCVTRAKARLVIGRHERDDARWIEALELEGCGGDPSAQRLAVAGAAAAARWIHPQEAVFVDGELMPGSQLLEQQVEGKSVVHQYQFPGVDLVFESQYVAPPKRAVPLRMLRGKQVLATYPGATVKGGVGLVERLLIVLDGPGLTVVELVGSEAVTLLSPEIASRPVD